MPKLAALTALISLALAACASVPDQESKEQVDSRVCTEDWEVGSPRDPAEVCRNGDASRIRTD